MFGGSRSHPEDKLGPEVPEDVVEEGDGQQKDGEEPSLTNDELQTVHPRLKTELEVVKEP